jgi:GNAT superfamily N-acetyltransferase
MVELVGVILRDFQHDPILRAGFNTLARETFNIDFEAWYQGGYWDEAYQCLAWVESGEVLATVGTTAMDLHIEDRTCRALQLGTVMTRADRRGRGLSSRLMEAALAWSGPVFLFADEDALDYYPRFGFRRIPQGGFLLRLDAAQPSPVEVRALDPGRPGDRARLLQLARSRTPVSRRLSVEAPSLLMWHALNTLGGGLFEVPGADLVVAGRRRGAVYHLYDLVGARLPSWEELRSCLPLEGIEAVAFHFTPDRVAPQAEWRPGDEDLFVRGELPFGTAPFCFPFTART